MAIKHPITARTRLLDGALRGLAMFVLLTIVLAPFGPAAAQTGTDLITLLRSLPPEAQSLPLRRFRYFYEQRAFPNQQIPPGAMQQAIREHEQQFGPLRQQPQLSPPPFSQNLWTSIGPTQILPPEFITRSGRTNTIAIDPTNTN